MSGTLTGSATYSNTATVPADGDTQTAASVNTPMQTLLNNTRYLQQKVESSGVRVIQSVADAAALAALVSISHGEVVMIGTNGAPSLWRRNTAGTGSSAHGVYIDHGTEAGGWDIVRISPTPIAFGSYTNTGAFGTSIATHNANTNWTDVTGVTCSVADCLVGDVVEIRTHFLLERSDVTYDSSARICVTENGGADIDLAQTIRQVALDANDGRFRTEYDMTARRTVVTAGAFVSKIQYKTSNILGTVALKTPGGIYVTVYR